MSTDISLEDRYTLKRVDLALAMAKRGLRIIPLQAGSKIPLAGISWPDVATTDPATIRQWLEGTDLNYGVAFDADTFALDLDTKGEKDGKSDLEALELFYGDLAPTMVVATPSGGLHVYLRGNVANSVARKDLGGGIDVRGDGGYVVGPGSVIDGKSYKILIDEPIGAAPAWLLALVQPKRNTPQKRAENISVDDPHEIAIMRDHLRRLVEQGDVAIEYCGGNNRTYQLAAELMDHVSQEITGDLLAEIWNPACQPPWSDGELRTIIANVAKHRQNDIGACATLPAAQAFAKADLAAITAPKIAPDAEGYWNSGGLSFRSMQDIAPAEIDWLWPERIAAGKLTLIAGAPDGGKSQIAANIAATISNGGLWPFGEGKTEQGAVIWLSAEDTAEDITVPRLIAAGANRRLIFELKPVVRVEGGLRTLNVAADLDEIASVIKVIKAQYGVPVKAIVIDPISAYMGGRSQTDSWKNSEVRHTMTPLLEFVGKYGISTLAITHFKKGTDADVLNRVIDSIALPALSRATWLVAPEKDDEGNPTGRRLFLVGKKNIGRPVPGLAYKIVEKLIDNGRGGTMPAPRVEWAGVVAATADDALADQAGRAGKLEAAEDFLMRILGDGPLTEKEIRKRTGEKHRWRTLQRAKEKLGVISERAGGLAGSGEWQWVLPGIETDKGDDPDAALFVQSSRPVKFASRPLFPQ